MSEPEAAPSSWVDQMKRNHERWIARYVAAQEAHVLALMRTKDRPLPAPATPQDGEAS